MSVFAIFFGLILAEHVASGAGSRWCGGAVVLWCRRCRRCQRSEKQGSAESGQGLSHKARTPVAFSSLSEPRHSTCSIPLFSPADPANNPSRASLPPSLRRLPTREFSRQTTDRESIHLSPIARRPPPFRQPFLNTTPLVESDAVTNNALPPARAVVISASRFPTISTTYIPHSRAEWSQQWPTRGGSDMARPPPPGGRRPSTTRRAHRCPSPALATIPSTPETSTWSQPTTSIPTTTTNTNPSPEAPSSVATPSPPPRHTRQGKNPWAEARA